MADTILLNKQPYRIKESELPCLVAYREHMGGSHLSVILVASLFLQGSKILFLTAYPMAKENFLQQVGPDHSKIAFVNSLSELHEAKNTQAIILKSGNEALFLEIAKSLPDLHERVILVKNIEVFSEKTFEICLNLEKVILSGNIDTCVAKEKISQHNFKTIIAFKQPTTSLPIAVPVLEKWTGYLLNDTRSGIVAIQKE